jgi:hypothetical protein
MHLKGLREVSKYSLNILVLVQDSNWEPPKGETATLTLSQLVRLNFLQIFTLKSKYYKIFCGKKGEVVLALIKHHTMTIYGEWRYSSIYS